MHLTDTTYCEHKMQNIDINERCCWLALEHNTGDSCRAFTIMVTAVSKCRKCCAASRNMIFFFLFIILRQKCSHPHTTVHSGHTLFCIYSNNSPALHSSRGLIIRELQTQHFVTSAVSVTLAAPTSYLLL